jgi:tetratricopeptide (TPR) repeat protein
MRSFLLALILVFCFATASAQDAKVVDSLSRVLSKEMHDTSRVLALCKLANEYRYNDPLKAREYTDQAAELAKENSFKKGLGRCYHLYGMIDMNQGNYKEALEWYGRSLEISTALGDKNSISTANNNMGMVYWNQGSYDNALKYFLVSLKIDEEMKNQSGMASSYNNIGLIYWAQGNYDKALENFTQVISIYSQLRDKKGMAGVYSNIGGVNYYKGKQDLAVSFFKKSLELYTEINNKPGMSTTCCNISDVLIEQKKYDEALTYSTRALKIEEEIGNKAQICYVLMSIAKNYSSRKQYEKAFSYLDRASDLAAGIHAFKQLSESYKMKAELYKELNRYRDAFEYHVLYMNIKDSLYNSESSSQIAEMDAKYNADKKNKEIELLRKEKEIRTITQEAEKSRAVFVRNSLIGSCAFVLLIAILLFNRNKVKQRANNALAKQKEQIQLQNEELGIKNKEITDSIKYAKRLQEAILPPTALVKRLLPDSFVLYRPKDIVSGDFYFIEEWGSKTFVAAVDCTGHGVPGAFMSIVGYNLLNQALNVYGLNKPFLILNDLNKNISKMLHQSLDDSTVKDGMDISLISIDRTNMLLEYAGAYNPLWIIRDGNLLELKADKFPVGAFIGEDIRTFSHQELPLQKGDMIYLFTDGYADQFGGEAGKKFKYKQLQKLLLEINSQSCGEQLRMTENVFESWRGKLEQVDDVLLIGIRI